MTGTWIPLDSGADLARRNGIYEKLRAIFEFRPGNDSPPPAPKHTTNKPKAPKKPAVPKFNSELSKKSHLQISKAHNKEPVSVPTPMREASYDNTSTQLNDDETPDDMTVASQSYIGDHDDYNIPQSQQSTGNRKRKRNTEEVPVMSYTEQQHTVYADELLDYFMLSQEPDGPSARLVHPEPPPHFQPNWAIDTEGHTALSWACSMGDVEVMKQLRRFNANIACRNIRGETPFMRSVLFVNCFDKTTFPIIAKELFETINLVDDCKSTVIHHAAALTHSKHKHHIARYYLDVILNRLVEVCEPDEQQRLIDAQDIEGNTACHIAAKNKARKCVRALIGRGASTDILNHEGVTAEDLISHLNNTRRNGDRFPQASSSPFAPPHRMDFPRPSTQLTQSGRPPIAHNSEAAMTVETKIAPTMAEKFRDLAKSFDDELIDLDNSEKEARRILNTTQEEVGAVREQIQDLLRREDRDEDVNSDEQLETLTREETVVMSLIEQQQSYILHSLVQTEDSRPPTTSTMNGTASPDHDLAEKNILIHNLAQEIERRKTLAKKYAEARSQDGGGEKVGDYRKLLFKTLGLDAMGRKRDELDGEVDGLLGVLVAEKEDVGREVDGVGGRVGGGVVI